MPFRWGTEQRPAQLREKAPGKAGEQDDQDRPGHVPPGAAVGILEELDGDESHPA